MELLTLSIGRNILKRGSGDRARMERYASHLTQLHIIVLTRKEHGYTEIVHEGNLHIYPTHSRNRLSMLTDALRIGQQIFRTPTESLRVVSAQDPFFLGLVSYVIARDTHASFHVQIHGDYFDSLWVKGSWGRRLEQFVALVLMRRADGIRVVSERIKRSLVKRGISATKISVLPIRPELEAFLRVVPVNQVSDTLECITVSRLASEKNIPFMLHAFARFVASYPHAHLRIVGSGTEEKRLRALVVTLGITKHVTFLPWSDDVPALMAEAGVFLLASDHEAYGLVLVEALAAGLPVVTTDVGCVGEVVFNEAHGIVVPPRDGDAYVRALTRIATDSVFRDACGVRGRETAHMLAQQSESAYTEKWVAVHTNL